jgi:RNA polymerase-binding transcription factor DksA
VTNLALLSLRCLHCGRREEFSSPQLLARLRELGSLRRGDEPSTDLLLELAQAAIADGRWGSCPTCGEAGLGAAPPEAEEDVDWGDARHCAECGAVIPAERIEIFPNSKTCAACQQKMESGAGSKDHEYCPRCGAVMQVKASRTPGATYRLYCPDCGKSF